METKSTLVDNGVGQEVNITRIFDAPRELVFKMWTDPELVEKWWGPKDFTNPVCKLDPWVGGSIRIVMRGPDGMQYPTRGVFTKIVEPELIVFHNIKEGDDGSAQLEIENTVKFLEEGGKTKMIFRAVVLRSTPDACQSIGGMNTGWNQSIDRLAENLQLLTNK
jgi:uncharacterized protein YndB with AHSA1/START domain